MIFFNLIVKQEAKKEISDIFFWYESRQKNLGNKFLDELDICFSTIKNNPKLFAKKHKDMRQIPLKKFPIIVIYEIENKEIIVFAVFHTSQNPEKWKGK